MGEVMGNDGTTVRFVAVDADSAIEVLCAPLPLREAVGMAGVIETWRTIRGLGLDPALIE